MNPEVENPKPEESTPLPQIRTFQGDVADALKDQGESVMSIRRAELTRQGGGNEFAPRPTPQETLEAKSTQKMILSIFGAIIFLGLGAVAVWYAYSGYKEKTALPTVVVIPNQFITSDSTANIDVTGLARESFISAFNIRKSENLKNNFVEHIQLNKGVSTTTVSIKTADFLNILNTQAPTSLVRALNPLFMLGTIGDTTDASSTPHTYLLIKVDSFENVFAGMLGWEQNLREDLLPLFASEETMLKIPAQTPFVDVIIQNKDTRALKDSGGNTVLLYTFFDNNMLIITDSAATLRTLIIKLNTSKLSR
jgi:hypothetical protein